MNIDAHLRTEIGEALSTSKRELFNEAQLKIQGLLEGGSFARFLRSDLYTDLVKAAQERNQSGVKDDEDKESSDTPMSKETVVAKEEEIDFNNPRPSTSGG